MQNLNNPVIRGHVTTKLIDSTTGEVQLLSTHPNQLTYAAADVCAAVFAGKANFIPRYMGVIFDRGTEGVPALRSHEERDHTWESIRDEMADNNCNMFLAEFTQPPVVIVPEEGTFPTVRSDVLTEYKANIVRYTGILRNGGQTYAFPAKAPYAGAGHAGARLHQLVLLAPGDGFPHSYIPVARAPVSPGSLQPPVLVAGIDFMIQWDVAFY